MKTILEQAELCDFEYQQRLPTPVYVTDPQTVLLLTATRLKVYTADKKSPPKKLIVSNMMRLEVHLFERAFVPS